MHDRCAKCGGAGEFASVDLTDLLCGSCVDAFNRWCDENPDELFARFLE